MSEQTLPLVPVEATAAASPSARPGRWAGYAGAVALVGAAVLVGFVIQHLITAPDVTLVFVLPVVIAATGFGFRQAMLAATLGVLAFDFFFTPPFYSLRIHRADDIWAAALLLAIAAIVSTLAADARRRRLDAEREAARANALHALARLVVEAAPRPDVERATAQALAQIFGAPSAVLVERDGELRLGEDSASLPAADLEAARWTLSSGTASHADNYPFEASTFDFWPIRREGSPLLVLGVRADRKDDWPETPAKYVELAGAYLCASLTAPRRP